MYCSFRTSCLQWSMFTSQRHDYAVSYQDSNDRIVVGVVDVVR